MIAESIGAVGLADEGDGTGRFARLVVEKPFGHDLASARALNTRLGAVFRERQVYRIDHYLGKETVQNLLVLRFGNAIFEPIWNRRYVDHVQITVSEELGVGHARRVLRHERRAAATSSRTTCCRCSRSSRWSRRRASRAATCATRR